MKIISNGKFEMYQRVMKKNAELERECLNIKNRVAAWETIEKERKELEHDRKIMKEEFKLKEKQVVAAYEDKLSKELAKQDKAHKEEMAQLRTKLGEENRKDLEKMLKENYEKLSSSMTKLHEEGNAFTKTQTEMAKEIIRAAGLNNANTTIKSIENVSEQ